MTIAQTASAENLDRQLPTLQEAANALGLHPPPMGWIRSLRTALGMSATALAKRLKVSHVTLLNYEKGERSGSISIATMRRVADALNADLVVACIPRKSVKDTLRERAEAIAREELKVVVQTMRLEDQEVDAQATKQQFEQLVEEMVRTPRRLWP